MAIVENRSERIDPRVADCRSPRSTRVPGSVTVPMDE